MPEPPRQNLEAEDDARDPPWRHLVRLVLRNWAWHEEDLRPEWVQLLLFKVSLVVSAVPRTVSVANLGITAECVVWASVWPPATWEASLQKVGPGAHD